MDVFVGQVLLQLKFLEALDPHSALLKPEEEVRVELPQTF